LHPAAYVAQVVVGRAGDEVRLHHVLNPNGRRLRVDVAEVERDVAVGHDAHDPRLAVASRHGDEPAVFFLHDPERAAQVVVGLAASRISRHQVPGLHE
jgi:hypothetical protein